MAAGGQIRLLHSRPQIRGRQEDEDEPEADLDHVVDLGVQRRLRELPVRRDQYLVRKNVRCPLPSGWARVGHRAAADGPASHQVDDRTDSERSERVHCSPYGILKTLLRWPILRSGLAYDQEKADLRQALLQDRYRGRRKGERRSQAR